MKNDQRNVAHLFHFWYSLSFNSYVPFHQTRCSQTFRQRTLKNLSAKSVEQPSGKRALKTFWQMAHTFKNQLFKTIWPRNRRRKVENGWKFACANLFEFCNEWKGQTIRVFFPHPPCLLYPPFFLKLKKTCIAWPFHSTQDPKRLAHANFQPFSTFVRRFRGQIVLKSWVWGRTNIIR